MYLLLLRDFCPSLPLCLFFLYLPLLVERTFNIWKERSQFKQGEEDKLHLFTRVLASHCNGADCEHVPRRGE